MRFVFLAILALSTIANGWLCHRAQQNVTLPATILVTLFAAVQGLLFMGLIKSWTVTQATIAYDVVVVICWYGVLMFWNEAGGWCGRFGLCLIAVGILLAGR